MNRKWLPMALVTVVAIITGCSAPPPSESAFLSGFPAERTVADSLPSTSNQGAMQVSSGGSTSSVWKDRRIHHRIERVELQISSADEAVFLLELNRNVRQARNEWRRSTGAEFWWQHSIPGLHGRKGSRLDRHVRDAGVDSHYTLIITITES